MRPPKPKFYCLALYAEMCLAGPWPLAPGVAGPVWICISQSLNPPGGGGGGDAGCLLHPHLIWFFWPWLKSPLKRSNHSDPHFVEGLPHPLPFTATLRGRCCVLWPLHFPRGGRGSETLSNWLGTHGWETEPGPELPHPKHMRFPLFPLGLEQSGTGPLTAGPRGGSGCWLSYLRAQVPLGYSHVGRGGAPRALTPVSPHAPPHRLSITTWTRWVRLSVCGKQVGSWGTDVIARVSSLREMGSAMRMLRGWPGWEPSSALGPEEGAGGGGRGGGGPGYFQSTFSFSGRSKRALWKGTSGRWSFTSARSACLLDVTGQGWGLPGGGGGGGEEAQEMQELGPEAGRWGRGGSGGGWAPQDCGV